jgi:hypothetical protein
MRNVTFRVGVWGAAGLLKRLAGDFTRQCEQGHSNWPPRVRYGAVNPTCCRFDCFVFNA